MKVDAAVVGGTIVTPDDRFDATIAIGDGMIVAMLEPGHPIEADVIYDATDQVVIPGGVDPHVHMMDPGYTEREEFSTGTAAAAVGGITTVGEHHRTDPMVLSADVFAEKRSYLSDRALVDYGLLAGGHPDNIDQMDDLQREGAMAFKSFTCEVHGVPALQSADMSRLFTEIAAVGGISMIHPEDELMLEENLRELEAGDHSDGSIVPKWRAKEAEQVAVSTTITIAEQTGVPLWFAHLSHPDVVRRVRRARDRGLPIYGETCPQYLYLTEEDVIADAPYTMFTPPARSETDRRGLWTHLAAGDIDMVNADHAPSTLEMKAAGEEDVRKAPFGIPGVETVLPLLLEGVDRGHIDLERVVEVFATNPARMMGIYPRKGVIRVGADADLVIVDPDETWTIANENIVSKCGWSPFDGMDVSGRIITTLVRGEAVVADGEVVGSPGHGRFIAPARSPGLEAD